MKFIFALLLASFSSLATEELDKRYKCIARGVYSEDDYEFIFGEFADTEQEAINSVMKVCQDQGFPYCQLIGCR